MKRQFTSILLFSALLVGGASTFVSCKDTESDALYETNGNVAEAVAKHAEDINKLATDLANETSERKAADKVLEDLINSKAKEISDEAATIKATAEAAKNKADANESKIGELVTKVASLEQQLSAYADLASRLGTAENNIEQLQQQIAAIKSCQCDYTSVQSRLAQLEANQATDEGRLAAVESGQSTLSEQISKINATLNGGEGELSYDEVKAQVNANKNKVESLATEVNNINNKFANYVTTEVYNQGINNLNQAIDNASTSLQNQLTALETKLTTQLNNLFEAMANEVTGVVVDRFYSPILGSYKDMLGTEARFLGAYYGYSTNDNSKIGDETINQDDMLVDETTGQNAGTIGVFINPANKDFSGLKFKIVDTQGNVTPFVATVTKSDKVEAYGYTRANVGSNYYLLKINVDPSQIANVKTWTNEDASELKAVAKNVLDKLKDRKNNLNLTEIANNLYHVFNNRLTEYHLALPQTLTDGTNKSLNVTIADKDFAATAIKPLGYKFLKNGISYDIKDIPTLESKGLYIDTSSLKWKDLDHIADIQQDIEIDVPDASTMTIDGNKVHITANGELEWVDPDNKTSIDDLTGVTVTVNGITFEAGAVKYDTKKQAVTVKVSMAQFNTMIDQINGQVGNMLGTVENLANKVNNFVTTIDGSLIDRVNRYIHKCNYWLDNANKFLQPAMFATDGTNWAKLPTIANGATYVKMSNGQANVLLLPTSYTLEYIAPAYKKYITVTDPSGAKVSGQNVGKVISGNVRKAGFTATKEGVYTITYEAVDYTGFKVSKNFYIKVVK